MSAISNMAVDELLFELKERVLQHEEEARLNGRRWSKLLFSEYSGIPNTFGKWLQEEGYISVPGPRNIKIVREYLIAQNLCTEPPENEENLRAQWSAIRKYHDVTLSFTDLGIPYETALAVIQHEEGYPTTAFWNAVRREIAECTLHTAAAKDMEDLYPVWEALRSIPCHRRDPLRANNWETWINGIHEKKVRWNAEADIILELLSVNSIFGTQGVKEPPPKELRRPRSKTTELSSAPEEEEEKEAPPAKQHVLHVDVNYPLHCSHTEVFEAPQTLSDTAALVQKILQGVLSNALHKRAIITCTLDDLEVSERQMDFFLGDTLITVSEGRDGYTVEENDETDEEDPPKAPRLTMFPTAEGVLQHLTRLMR